MHDAMTLEGKGIPTVVLCTNPFLNSIFSVRPNVDFDTPDSISRVSEAQELGHEAL